MRIGSFLHSAGARASLIDVLDAIWNFPAFVWKYNILHGGHSVHPYADIVGEDLYCARRAPSWARGAPPFSNDIVAPLGPRTVASATTREAGRPQMAGGRPAAASPDASQS